MEKKDLIEYVRRYIGEYPEEAIRAKLSSGGCTQAETDEAFAAARGLVPPAPDSAQEPAWQPGAAGAEVPTGSVLRKVFGIPLILISFGPLTFGGALLGPNLNMILLGRSFDPKVFLLGLLLGVVGAALIYGGVVLCRDRGMERASVQPWEVLFFGLCFPGAAQAYGGRWWRCAFFLLLPWLLMILLLFAAVPYGVAAKYFGLPAATIFGTVSKIFMPSVPFYALLWIASLAEGYNWADSLPQGNPQREIPRWTAPVLGLGAIAFFLVSFLLLIVTLVGFSLKTGLALKGAVSAAQSPVQGDEIRDKDPLKREAVFKSSLDEPGPRKSAESLRPALEGPDAAR